MKEKLDIFEASNFINNNERKLIEKWQNKLSMYDKEALNVCLTHLVMVINRYHNNEDVDDLNEDIFNEVKNSDNYQEALKIVEAMKEDFTINAKEEKFMLLHLCNLLTKEGD